MKSNVYQGQNLLDKSIEMAGGIEFAFFIALENGLSLTDTFIIGLELSYSGNKDESITALFGKLNRPASALSTAEKELVNNEDCRIGSMKIGSTFIIK